MPTNKRRQYRHLPAFILLLLTEGPVHGRAISTSLLERMPAFKTDAPAIYRSLQQMELDGEVKSKWDMSQRGPARRVYRITDKGWERLEAWKEDISHRLAILTYFVDAFERAQKIRVKEPTSTRKSK